MPLQFRYHHIGIPTRKIRKGMTRIKHLRIRVTDHESNPFGIQWMYFDNDCPVPELVRKAPHVAFVVDDLEEALRDRKVIIPPNSPSPGVMVALIEEQGAPVEFLQLRTKRRSRKRK